MKADPGSGQTATQEDEFGDDDQESDVSESTGLDVEQVPVGWAAPRSPVGTAHPTSITHDVLGYPQAVARPLCACGHHRSEGGGQGPWVEVAPGALLEVMRTLKEDTSLAFNHLCDLTAVDFSKRTTSSRPSSRTSSTWRWSIICTA